MPAKDPKWTLRYREMQSNSIKIIHPYKYQGVWVFDDEKVGLVREPFVSGADDIIERLVTSIPKAKHGFSLIFSDIPFPGYQAEFAWVREEAGGNWDYTPGLNCYALRFARRYCRPNSELLPQTEVFPYRYR